MLPDFPTMKTELLRRVGARIQAEAKGGSFLSDVASSYLHEGDRVVLHREDGSEEALDFATPLTAVTEMKIEAMREGGTQAIEGAITQVAEQLGEGMTIRTLAQIERTSAAVGNTVDAAGRQLDAELLLEMLGKMELSFLPDGSWDLPTLVVHPDMMAKAKAAWQDLQEVKEKKARLDALVEDKRKEWRAREARRTLVD